MKFIGWFRFALLFLFGMGSASAQDLAMGYLPALEEGDSPTLSIVPARAVAEMQVDLEVGGQTRVYNYDNVAAGKEIIITWERNPSITSADAMIRAVFTDGFVSEYMVPMTYSYGSPLDIDIDSVKVDDESGVITVDVEGHVDQAELVSIGARGVELGREVIQIGAGPGPIEIQWSGYSKEVVRLDVTLSNETAHVAFEYSPWHLNIPHQDVLFDSNDATIAESEEWKLEATLTKLKEVDELYGELIDVKLYIGGCTDTVGNASSNRDLSARRARAIAVWLKQHGYSSPIFTYGFGEDWLAIPTGDGVDEQGNRRAVYMVGTRPPPAKTGAPQVKWRPL